MLLRAIEARISKPAAARRWESPALRKRFGATALLRGSRKPGHNRQHTFSICCESFCDSIPNSGFRKSTHQPFVRTRQYPEYNRCRGLGPADRVSSAKSGSFLNGSLRSNTLARLRVRQSIDCSGKRGDGGPVPSSSAMHGENIRS